MELCVIPVAELDKKIYRKLIKLNLGDKGLMKFYLKTAYRQEEARLKYRRNETAIILYDNGRIVCWVLLLDARACCGCKWKKTVHIYTRASKRGKGYANYLILKTIDLCKPAKLYCRGNTTFFNKYGIKYA